MKEKQICCGGYGIFKVEKSNNQERYINVVTNKEWKISFNETKNKQALRKK